MSHGLQAVVAVRQSETFVFAPQVAAAVVDAVVNADLLAWTAQVPAAGTVRTATPLPLVVPVTVDWPVIEAETEAPEIAAPPAQLVAVTVRVAVQTQEQLLTRQFPGFRFLNTVQAQLSTSTQSTPSIRFAWMYFAPATAELLML